ncbi:MAG: CBS domain-containing protein, partial [Epsilonproteobacteria bacterium]|nr:CBS domain-containing protein [Campylobacterota bacterium]
RLKAILSDGDLRRALMSDDFSLEKKAILFASKEPKTIKDRKMLASEALKLIEDYKIQLLVLTNDKDEVEGVVHIHDLVEAGIK